LDHGLHICELNVVRHALMLCDLRFPYTPILARNSENQLVVCRLQIANGAGRQGRATRYEPLASREKSTASAL